MAYFTLRNLRAGEADQLRSARRGKQLDVPFVHIWTLEGEQAIQFRQYLDKAGWVGALQG